MNKGLEKEVIADYGVLLTLITRFLGAEPQGKAATYNALQAHLDTVCNPLMTRMLRDKSPETIEERFQALEKRLEQIEGGWLR